MEPGDAPQGAPSDEALVERVRDCDGAAFDTLFGRYFARIHRFVTRRVERPADVEAAVEDIFAQMLSALDAFRGEKPFAAWLLSVTKRTLERHTERRADPSTPKLVAEPELPPLTRSLVECGSGATSLLARVRRLLLPR